MNKAEQKEWYEQAMGCSQEILDENLKNQFGDVDMLIMGTLSDAQEILEHGNEDHARQMINRAKYYISHQMQNRQEYKDSM